MRVPGTVVAIGLLLALQHMQSTPALAQAPVTADVATFDILEYIVEGNSVLAPVVIERAVYPHLGPGRRFADIERARKALEDTYQQLGYQTVFVDIPEQRIQNGTVRLRVLEGTVERTRVIGARYYSQGEIRAQVSELAPGAVPDFNVVQEQLGAVNKQGDRQVAPVLRPGQTPGTLEVDLSVKDRLPLHIDAELNNRASPFTTDLRLQAGVRYDNLWQRQHSLGLNYQVSPEDRDEVDVLYGTYVWRFRGADDAVALYGVRSKSRVAIVGSSTVLGDARIYGARWIKPIGVSRGAFQSISLGVDSKDFAQTNLAAITGVEDVLPAIRYSPLTFAYSLNRATERDTLQTSITVGTAPRGILGNTDQEFADRRFDARASYVAWKYDLSYERLLGSRFSGFAKLEGQWTADALIPNEQFTAGGAESVRGYLESEIFGDVGNRATLEARYRLLGGRYQQAPRSLHLVTFFDAAQVRLAGEQIASRFISSAGLGLRAWGWYGLRIAADYAYAFKDGGRGINGFITQAGDWRTFVRLGYEN